MIKMIMDLKGQSFIFFIYGTNYFIAASSMMAMAPNKMTAYRGTLNKTTAYRGTLNKMMAYRRTLNKMMANINI